MNEPLHDGLDGALRRLRDDAASKNAPDTLEDNLLQAFRTHHADSGKRRRWVWGPAAIAASLLIGVASQMWQSFPVEAPVVPVMPARQQVAAPAQLQELEPATQVAPRRRLPAKRRVRPVTARPAERLSLASSRPIAQPQEFVEIPYAPPFSAYDQGQVVRVNMAGSSARRMGVPVLVDRVQADLLVGNDGLPRAIRLVSNSGNQFQ